MARHVRTGAPTVRRRIRPPITPEQTAGVAATTELGLSVDDQAAAVGVHPRTVAYVREGKYLADSLTLSALRQTLARRHAQIALIGQESLLADDAKALLSAPFNQRVFATGVSTSRFLDAMAQEVQEYEAETHRVMAIANLPEGREAIAESSLLTAKLAALEQRAAATPTGDVDAALALPAPSAEAGSLVSTVASAALRKQAEKLSEKPTVPKRVSRRIVPK